MARTERSALPEQPGRPGPPVDRDTRGIVRAAAGFERFRLTRHAPSPALEWAVDRYWLVRWDVTGSGPYEQRIVPHPAVHLVFEAGRAEVQAISRHEFVRRLEGRGHVLGVKFRPAGFRPFLGRAVSTVAGQRLPATAIPALAGHAGALDDLARRLAAAGDVLDDSDDGDTARGDGDMAQRLAIGRGDAGDGDGGDDLDALVGDVEGLLAGLGVEPLPATAAVNAVVDQVVRDGSIVRVDDLAARLGTSTRRLQRLFADHVGLGPKWVINRGRILEAAELAATDAPPDWAALAADLGYSDQSHLVRDFTATVGTPPDRYARESRS